MSEVRYIDGKGWTYFIDRYETKSEATVKCNKLNKNKKMYSWLTETGTKGPWPRYGVYDQSHDNSGEPCGGAKFYFYIHSGALILNHEFRTRKLAEAYCKRHNAKHSETYQCGGGRYSDYLKQGLCF